MSYKGKWITHMYSIFSLPTYMWVIVNCLHIIMLIKVATPCFECGGRDRRVWGEATSFFMPDMERNLYSIIRTRFCNMMYTVPHIVVL
jgi:hypothetical protein